MEKHFATKIFITKKYKLLFRSFQYNFDVTGILEELLTQSALNLNGWELNWIDFHDKLNKISYRVDQFIDALYNY